MAVPLSGSECGLFVLLLLFWFLILNQCERVHSEPTQDKQALLAFISQVPHANRLQWNQSDSPCNWVGVECDPTRSYVSKLRLPGIGLLGPIPLNTLGNLTQLRVISIHSNALIGKLPSDFSNLKLLRSLYIQHNQFSGDFPPSLSELTRLARLDISTNNFTGKIPLSINNLSRLTGLFMQNNNFSGPIPNLNSSRLVDLNISNNHFNGSIPKALKKFPISSFSGNIDLCGGPLQKCKPFSTSPTPPPPLPLPRIAPKPSHKKSKKLPLGVIIAIAGGVAAFIVLLLMCLIICLMKRKQDDSNNNNNNQAQNPTEGSTAAAVAEAGTSSGKDEMKEEECGVKTNKLILIDEGVYKFNLDDLLRASAEMLGKGSYGISYKATLDEEPTVVVKRLKDATLSGKEFEMHVDELGKIRHHNVVPLIAFYHSKNEKLLIYDYMPAGSLSALLHGSRDSGRPPPDWETRIKIATSAAKGLAHLHSSGKIVHGNIKSSNILIRDSDSLDAAVADYGLSTFFSGESSPDDHHRLGGYRAPEVAQTRKATLKSDVYSFGVLLLEMLTGKSPFQKTSVGEEGIDLPRWVQSIVREEWTAEVFDMELMRYEDVEEEMVQLLQIAMTCVATVPDQRPAMLEVVRLIEETIGSGTPPITITP